MSALDQPAAPANPLTQGTTLAKTIETALWLAASAALGFLVSSLAGTPDLFGPYTLAANIALTGLTEVVNAKRSGQTLKAAAYLGVSAAITFLITSIEGSPHLLGDWTFAINLALVAVKNALDPRTPNA